MICGYTTFELERVPVRERWDRVPRAPSRPDGTRAMIQSRGGRHWCPLFGSEHVHGSRSSGRAVGTAAGASARSARMTRASRLKRAFARVSRNAPSWSRTGTPRRLFPRARTPTRPPRGPPRCGPWTPQPRSRRARDPSWRPRRARREERRDAPGRYAPRRRRRAERSARDLGRCAKKRTKKSDEETWMRVFEFGMAVGRLSRARSGGFSTCFQKRNCRTVFFSIFTLHVRWSNKDPRGLFGNAYVSNTTPQFVTT